MSQQRRCDIFKATDNKWYLTLGNFEYAEEDWDCTNYGPFASEARVDSFLLEGFSNPGGAYVDRSGTASPPNPN